MSTAHLARHASTMTFTKDDRRVLDVSTSLLGAAIEAASNACSKLGFQPAELETLATMNKAIGRTLDSNIDTPRFDLEHAWQPAVRVALRLQIDKLDKISKGQLTLEIDPSDTNERLLHVQRLLDRIKRANESAAGQVAILPHPGDPDGAPIGGVA